MSEQNIGRIAAQVMAKAMIDKHGFDFDVPADYASRFEADATAAGLEVVQINEAPYNGLITYGVYRDHPSMTKRENER